MRNIDVIFKKLRNNLTPEEEIIFQEWLKSSNVNERLYKRLLQLKNEGSGAYDISELDVNAAWKAIQENVKPKQKSKVIPFYKRKVVQYAAAVLVGILATSYIFKGDLFSKPIEDSPIIVKTNIIETGTDKAVLTLGDGSVVALEKGQTFQSNNIKSTGEELVYNAANTTKEEITYNYLTIPRGGEWLIKLSDGTQVWLNSESQLKYPTSFVKGESRKVELVYGEAYFDVSPSTAHNGSKFIVHNQNQDIEVLGTEFNIKAYKDETNIYTTLVEGLVLINQEGTKQKLLPNQQSVLDKNTNTIEVANVDVYNEISWKEGIFSFDGKTLKEIMKVMSRWYDMEVVFMNKDIEDEEFVGVLRRNRDINKVLSGIKSFGTIKDYTISGKNVVLK
ncbi:FecR family protein [Flavivirga spongiicola]|uniref:FecR domain-containing protein n=1 Tax=Flavivirga spongiicola TaxID=421621 RepID=A0ABU7XW38_9FLAO|nr:FecR family protein [Flavivirga sp. MEBiC05379]MDO5979783.1 FecR domain-containing protein [Flavivirga sp. MEBiC05379]